MRILGFIIMAGAMCELFLGVIGLLAIGVVGFGMMYIGQPLLVIPSFISGVDIVKFATSTNWFCTNVSIGSDDLFSLVTLPTWIGWILFFTMEVGLYAGSIAIIVGFVKGIGKGPQYYADSWSYGTLKNGKLLLIFGIGAAIALGILVRYLNRNGACS